MFHEQSSYWHVILKVDFIRPDTRWLWNTPPNRVVMKWDWGKTKLESELMPAKRPCLHFIIIIMFNKQSFMLLGKRDNQRHRRGSIKECFKPWIKTYLFKPSAGLFWLHMNAVNSWEHRGIAGHKRGAWVFREEFQAPPPSPPARLAGYQGETAWLQGENLLPCNVITTWWSDRIATLLSLSPKDLKIFWLSVSEMSKSIQN